MGQSTRSGTREQDQRSRNHIKGQKAIATMLIRLQDLGSNPFGQENDRLLIELFRSEVQVIVKQANESRVGSFGIPDAGPILEEAAQRFLQLAREARMPYRSPS